MSKGKLNIQVIVGTVRTGRTGRKVADWYVEQARAAAPDVDFEILDAWELGLPLFREPTPPAYHQYGAEQQSDPYCQWWTVSSYADFFIA